MHTRHLTGPGELIAAIPAMLGRTPREAVVAVGLDDAGEIVTALRVDRRDATVADSAGSLSRAVGAKLRAVAARRVFLVSFTGDDVTLGCPAVEALRPGVAAAVTRVDVWACDGDRYFSPGCADPSCCPVGGRPVPWDGAGVAAAASASAVAHAAPDDGDERAPNARRRSAARAADRWWARRGVQPEQWRCESWQRLAEAFPIDANAPAVGRAIAGLQDIRVRDALIVEWLGGEEAAVLDTLRGRESAAVADVLDGAMRDPMRQPPDQAGVVATLRWCRRLIAHARRRELAPLLALSAVVLWWSGNLPGAYRAAQTALRHDPAYSLARLVQDVAYAEIAPAWCRARGATREA